MNANLIEEGADGIRYEIVGEIVNSNDFHFLEDHLSQKQQVELDLTGVTYINSSGFGAMVEETMNFREAGLTIQFSGLETNIRKTIGILGAEELLDFKD